MNLLTKQAMRKIPEVIVIFWIIKLLTIAMGEATSDFLVQAIDPVIAVILCAIGFSIAIILQISVRRYIPWIYWFAVVMVAVFGTMAVDVMHIVLYIPYLVSSSIFVVALIQILIIWYKIEKTLSIHSIFNRKRELFYWATVLATFALGTVAGDMTASTLNLGYFTSAILFAVLFAIPAVAWKFFKLNAIVAFWFA